MSEAEVKQIEGVCSAITERNGWTEFEIDHGGQYTTKLSTKLPALIELGRSAKKENAVWTYKESDGKENPNRPGTFYKNRYLEKVEVGGTISDRDEAAVQATAQSRLSDGVKFESSTASGNGMTKEEWARKDSAIHMMAAIKSAADALKHTLPSEPSQADLQTYVERVKFLSYNWWQRADAVRKGDDSDLPFLSEQDDSVPY